MTSRRETNLIEQVGWLGNVVSMTTGRFIAVRGNTNAEAWALLERNECDPLWVDLVHRTIEQYPVDLNH